MANFPPLKRYILYCIDKLITRYHLSPEFLDVGCGIGDVSLHLATKKGWKGKAIDISDEAILQARAYLAEVPNVKVEKLSFQDEPGSYNTVFLLDMLEHIPDDLSVIRKLALMIKNNGHAVITVPSNPRWWHWDDDFYGHVRRYTPKGIERKLWDAGLTPIVIWDFTFPIFWFMRRMYTKFSPPVKSENSLENRTMESGLKPGWQNSVFVAFISALSWLWRIIYFLSFRIFRNQIRWGHEIIVLAQKID